MCILKNSLYSDIFSTLDSEGRSWTASCPQLKFSLFSTADSSPSQQVLSSSCCSAEAEPAPISWDSTNVFMVYKHQTSDPQFEKITSGGFCCCIYTRFGNCSGIAALWYWQCRLPKYSHWERLNYRKARRGKDLVLPCTATTKKKFKSTLQSEGPAVLCNCIKPKSISNSIALYHSQFQTTHNWLTII